MTALSLVLRAARELGPGSLALYGLYRAARRIGWIRRSTPMYTWDQRPLRYWVKPGISVEPKAYWDRRRQQRQAFFFHPDSGGTSLFEGLGEGAVRTAQEEAERVLAGKFRLFGTESLRLGFPPDWGAFAPLAGGGEAQPLDMDRHWTDYAVDGLPADIKLLWEPSRFAFVYPLARAYRLDGDRRYLEAFWQLLSSWREANQPHAGPHWISAQEVAFRLLALTFSLYAFLPALEDDPTRVVVLAQTIGVHADRIPSTLIYARAQGNNHLLTEAAALYTAGLLFPEFRRAARWRALGRRWFIRGVERQVFADGGYVQHSSNYHRLALQIALWTARLAELNGQPLTEHVMRALRRSTDCLAAMVDPGSGRVPNFGPNDGALLLPLSSCPATDFRPTLQAAACAFHGRRVYPPGPWDETSRWLGLPPGCHRGLRVPAVVGEEERAPRFPAATAFPEAGFYFLRAGRSRGMLRCARFRSRPGHADLLHLDLWWRGVNVALDPGTYLYGGEPPWDNGLASAAVHNTVTIDAQEPMQRAGRFLWLDWPCSTILGAWRGGEIEVLVGETAGYRRLGVLHRRTVARLGEDLWLVVDDLLGGGRHSARVGWLLPEGTWVLEDDTLQLDLAQGRVSLRLQGVKTCGLYRRGRKVAGEGVPEPHPLWGWCSPTYAVKEPALHLVGGTQGTLPLRLISRWSLGGAGWEGTRLEWREPAAGRAAVSWLEHGGTHLDLDDAHSADPSGFRRAG